MDKALVTKPEYNLGSLFCPALVTRPEEHGGRITDTCLFLLLLYYKITIPKDWSLNSRLLNLVLTEIRKNPSSTVYGPTHLKALSLSIQYSQGRPFYFRAESPLLVLTAV